MTDEEAFSVTIDIPKPVTFSKSYKDTIKYKRTSYTEPRKLKLQDKSYALPALSIFEPLPAAAFEREEILLPFLRFTKSQKRERKENLNKNVFEEYKTGYIDLQNLLHINDPADESRGLTHYDPTFFTCVKTTTFSSYVAPYKSLKYLFNNHLSLRQVIGYRRDCVLNIETKYKKEQEVYDCSVKRWQKQIKYFDEFISADYQKSMLFLKEWDKTKIALDQKTIELHGWATKKFTVTSKIIELNYKYGLQQKYGRFLYYLSPPSWRLKNRHFALSIEIEAKGFAFGISSEEDTFNIIYENLKKECVSGLIKPVLYFQHPNDLLNIFDGIEKQHWHHYVHVARLRPHTSFLKKGIRMFKDIIEKESAGVISVIKEYEKKLFNYEEQNLQLKSKFFKILNISFYNSVGASEVLKFQLHLEFCYKKIYNENPVNLSITGTAKALEDFYMCYTKKLDFMTTDVVTNAVKESIETERRQFKRAKLAAKELRLFQRLERALLRAYAPLSNKILVSQSQLQRTLPNKVIFNTNVNYNIKRLTDSEIEYLMFFTDWTENDNPAHYLRSLSIDDDE